MGLAITQTSFSEQDFARYSERLGENLSALSELLNRPGFGVGPTSFGAELELYIIDDQGYPKCINQQMQADLDDPLCTLELNRFNLEYNFEPVWVTEGPFRVTEKAALKALQKMEKCAVSHQAHVLPIGILPTLRRSDVGYQAMTRIPRYDVLTRELREIRGGPFTIDIRGQDHIHLEMQDVTLEGANTSFQIHLRVPPTEFADTYNAVQLVTPLAMALGANSPSLFGRQLWHETRIPLFKQSIDCRPPDPVNPQPARVNFGHSWIRKGALELFKEAVYLYRPLMPVVSDEDPLAVVREGGVPALGELRLQQGSVWLWNRPVYDPSEGGHLRIEMRALPAGPSMADMLANAVLIIGLAELVKPMVNRWLPAIPFEYAVRNFYRAAEFGLQAELIWPSESQREPTYHSAAMILHRLLPQLPQALTAAGYPSVDFLPYIDVLQQRLESGQTGAVWQTERLKQHRKHLDLEPALQAMVQDYRANVAANLPVGAWSLS